MTKLEQELAQLKQRATEMGALAEAMVAGSARAVVTLERATLPRVLADEPVLDGLQMEIDREVIRLITVYSPAARHLRFLVMMLRINSELERIGDQAVTNCEYVELLAAGPPRAPCEQLSQMSALALRMLREALQAFHDDDVQRARAVMALDDQIDAMNADVVRHVLGRTASEGGGVTQSVGLLVARSFERIADHATNICEEVFYVVEGEDIRHRT
jgi:phosphate transport system protein